MITNTARYERLSSLFLVISKVYMLHILMESIIIPKVTLFVFRVRCGTLKSNQSKELECAREYPLIHFNVLIKFLLGCEMTFVRMQNRSDLNIQMYKGR